MLYDVPRTSFNMQKDQANKAWPNKTILLFELVFPDQSSQLLPG